jgi:hypothetical protein
MTHGTTYIDSYYPTALSATTDAGKVVLLTQGSDISETQFGNYNNVPLSFFTNNADRMTILGDGNVGIGTTSPQANSKLQVNGAASSFPNTVTSGASVDLSLSNIHYLKAVGGTAIALSNIANGGSYTIVIADTTARTYTFTGCTNSYFSPANSDTLDRSTYSIMTIVDGSNTECFISWVTGYAP